MPTLAALAGVALPQDRVFDGIDLGPVIFQAPGKATAHEALFHPNGAGELKVVRYKQYMVYYEQYTASDCSGNKGGTVQHSTPLVFDVVSDPAESTPVQLDADTLKTVEQLLAAKEASIKSTLSHKADYSSSDQYAPCCDSTDPVCRCPWSQADTAAAGGGGLDQAF